MSSNYLIKTILLSMVILLTGCTNTTTNTFSPTFTPAATTTPSYTSNSPSPSTTNLRSYTNPTSGYTLKYPQDWKVTDFTKTVATKESLIKTYVAFSPDSQSVTDYIDAPIYISEGVGKSYAQRVNLAENYDGYGPSSTMSKSNLLVAGNQAVSFEGTVNNQTNPKGQTQKLVIVDTGGVVTLRANDPYIAILNEMIKTISFK